MTLPLRFFCTLALIFLCLLTQTPARSQDTAGMGQEQAKEREELEKMHNEVKDIKGTINDAVESLNQLNNQAQSQNVHEFHLFAREAQCEVYSGLSVGALTYNGKIPGPPLRVQEGEVVRVVLHNQLKVPTSLLFHGVIVPQSVGGLPHKDAGLVQPGQSFAYQFIVHQPGTFWYHPQVINQDQKVKGMYGAFIVEPKSGAASDKDLTFVLSQMQYEDSQNHLVVAANDNSSREWHKLFLLNGKSAPAIPPLELRQGERVRMRMINTAPVAIPIHMSGHRWEVIATNGSDLLEPHVYRDTITLNPSDRVDLEFTADNPGVWSFASEVMEQASTNGKFPGGIAFVVKYSGMSN